MDSFAEWKNDEYVVTLKYSKEEVLAFHKVDDLMKMVQLVLVAKYLNKAVIKLNESEGGVNKND
jgi:hypothetical protein